VNDRDHRPKESTFRISYTPLFYRAVGKTIPFMFVFLEHDWEVVAACTRFLHSGGAARFCQRLGKKGHLHG
jgi:hypothetical protein